MPQIFSEICVITRNVSPNPDRPPDQLDRRLRLPLLSINNPQQMQRIRMIWRPGKNLPINSFRLSKPPGPMMHERAINRPCRGVVGRFVSWVHG